ncbi:MAG: hypothetical protein HYW71_01280 [Candidatus Niyogibacteria bacterium]|nr:hypothetical protein [Candidatus Niyogibacteria bacterium]
MNDSSFQANNNKENINRWQRIFIGIAGLIIFIQYFNAKIKPPFGSERSQPANIIQNQSDLNLEEAVLPSEGVVLPVRWGDLGRKLVSAGVIDQQKFESLYADRGGLKESERKFIESADNGSIKITAENSSFFLNLFWALGLSVKNEILEKGPMVDPSYGGAENFASTGGWTLANGGAMDHYSRYSFIILTPEQQQIVERVSQNIYRPCCGNSVYFPDCNHGMAMLGLLELMASQGISEKEMYKAALRVNSYWFPDTYLTIAKYFEKRGVSWDEIDPKEILGSAYSSAQGFRRILEQTEPLQFRGGGGCGV